MEQQTKNTLSNTKTSGSSIQSFDSLIKNEKKIVGWGEHTF